MNLIRLSFSSLFLFVAIGLMAQTLPLIDIDFTVDGKTYRNPMVGGLNSPQFSEVDLNDDGILDLYIFDRIGHVNLTFINNGTANEVDYDYNPKYAKRFPEMTDWVLLRDFNGDGAMDIFTYSDAPGIDGVRVFEGYFEDDILKFTRFNFYDNVNNLIYFPLFSGTRTNLYVSTEDYPAVDDIDYDGDLDFITFGNGGGYVYWFKNMSVEEGFGTDSLHFELVDDCLGHAYESGLTGCLDLSPSVDSCATGFAGGGGAEQRHAGSTLLLFDEDNDGDKELVLGDVNGEELTRLVNGGNSQSNWYTGQDCFYPSYDESAYLVTFPASFYLDVNNDNKRDLLVSPNRGQLAEDVENVWYYKNINTDEAPVFEKTSENLFVSEMLDLGTGTRPAFADFNADGLMDLLVGNETYFVPGGDRDQRLFLFYNIGTETEPSFELVNDNFLTLNEYQINWSLAPALGDLDNDGDLDLLVGEENGTLFHFENTAGAGNPITFGPTNFAYLGIDVGQVSTPTIVDINRDGLMDLVVGERNGNLNYFPNIGSTGNPMFEPDPELAPNNKFFGQVDTRLPNSTEGYSSPFFVDFDGEYMLFCGSRKGQIWRYENIDGNLDGAFTLEEQPYGRVYGGFRTHPVMIDINNNGVMNLVVGNRRGGLAMYASTYNVDGTVPNNDIGESLDVSVFPNPSSDRVTFDIIGAGNQKIKIDCYDNLGRQVASQTTVGVRQVIDVSRMPGGVYYCRVSSGNMITVVKFVVR